MQVIVNTEVVSQLQEATGASYEEANQAYIVSCLQQAQRCQPLQTCNLQIFLLTLLPWSLLNS